MLGGVGGMTDLLQQKIDKNYKVLERISTFRRPAEVRRFLETHFFLFDLIPEALSRARRIFGPNTKVELEVVKDPEGDNPEILFAYIVTSLPVNDALGLIDKLDDEWFLDQSDKVQDTFNLNLKIL